MHVLPDADGQVARENRHHHATGQAVQAVGEVHGVRTRQGDEGNPHGHQDGTKHRTGGKEVNRQVAHEGNRGGCGARARLVGELESQEGEGNGHREQADGLLTLGQALVAFVAELHDVIRSTHAKHAQGKGDGQPRGGARQWRGTEENGANAHGQQVRKNRRRDENQAGHGGGARLVLVGGGALIANQLTELEGLHLLDEHRKRGQGDKEPEDSCNQHGNHEALPFVGGLCGGAGLGTVQVGGQVLAQVGSLNKVAGGKPGRGLVLGGAEALLGEGEFVA